MKYSITAGCETDGGQETVFEVDLSVTVKDEWIQGVDPDAVKSFVENLFKQFGAAVQQAEESAAG